MTEQNFAFEVDADGIALLTWDMPGRSMNVFTIEVMDEIDRLVDRIVADDAPAPALRWYVERLS